jgi:hypothetical protein
MAAGAGSTGGELSNNWCAAKHNKLTSRGLMLGRYNRKNTELIVKEPEKGLRTGNDQVTR